MKINWKWTISILAGLAILFFLPYLLSLFMGVNWGGGMMRYGYAHPMMFDGRYDGFSPFGGLLWGIGRLVGGLIPLALLALAIYGGIMLFNRNRPIPAAPSGIAESPARACPNCAKSAAEDWSTCPYCGTTL